jgi:hypothetical protein
MIEGCGQDGHGVRIEGRFPQNPMDDHRFAPRCEGRTKPAGSQLTWLNLKNPERAANAGGSAARLIRRYLASLVQGGTRVLRQGVRRRRIPLRAAGRSPPCDRSGAELTQTRAVANEKSANLDEVRA